VRRNLLDLRRRHLVVHRDEDSPAAPDAVHGDEESGVVERHHHDPVPGQDAARGEHRGSAVGGVPQFPVGQGVPTPLDGGVIGVASHAGVEDVDEIHGAALFRSVM